MSSGIRRSRVLVGTILAVVVVLAGAATWAALSRHGGQPSTHSSASPSTRIPAAPVRAVQAPGGGSLRVVASGVSMGTNTLGQPMASYGIVLENTSQTHVAFDAEFSVTMFDASGQPVTDQMKQDVGQDSTHVTTTVEFAAPGQRFGIGRETYVPRGSTVTRVTAEVGNVSWLATKDVRTARLTTGDVATSYDPGKKRTTVRFTVESEYPVRLHPLAVAIFRDASGTIVGGTSPEDSKTGKDDYPPGASQQEIRSIAPLPGNADINRTEVYVYPQQSAFRIQ